MSKPKRWYALSNDEMEILAIANTLPKLQNRMDALAKVYNQNWGDDKLRRTHKFVVTQKRMRYLTKG